MNTLPPDSRARIQQALSDLFAEADVAEPEHLSPIVPLGEIISSTNLNCVEIPNLTLYTAMLHLTHQRTLAELPNHADEHDPLAGFLYATLRYGTIFARQNDLIVRRRFSVAHELGHYYLHIRPHIPELRAQDRTEIFECLPQQPAAADENDDDVTAPTEPPPGELHVVGGSGGLPWAGDLVEREADAFAAALLMPEMVVRLLHARYRAINSSKDLVWRLAGEMLVSSTAMRRRLQDLRLIGAT